MQLKRLQKESFKKPHKQLVIWLVIKLLIKLQKFQKTHHKIIQRQLVTNENDKETPNEKYLSPEERREIIDELRLK